MGKSNTINGALALILVKQLKSFHDSVFISPLIPLQSNVLSLQDDHTPIDLKSFLQTSFLDKYPQLTVVLEHKLFELLGLYSTLLKIESFESYSYDPLILIKYEEIINNYLPPLDLSQRKVLCESFKLFGFTLITLQRVFQFNSPESSLEFFGLLMAKFPENRPSICLYLLNRIRLFGCDDVRYKQLSDAINLLNIMAYLDGPKDQKSKQIRKIFINK